MDIIAANGRPDVRRFKVLYKVLSQCLQTYLKHLEAVSVTHSGIDLVQFYVEKWNAFNLSSHAIRSGYRDLDRHWVQKRKQIKKNIAEPYRLCFQRWRTDFFLVVKERLLEVCRAMRQNGKVFNFTEYRIGDEQLSQDFQDILPSKIYKL